MNVEIGTVATQFLFWGIFVSNFQYWFFAVCEATRYDGRIVSSADLEDAELEHHVFLILEWVLLQNVASCNVNVTKRNCY
jgi:hypothetical protein